jgi:hypothetical protein
MATIAATAMATLALAAPAVHGGVDMEDPRADSFGGNATNCGTGRNGIGVGGTLAFADGDDPIDDGNVSGYVTDGKFVNVDTPLEANVNILAVVVKGGPAYNVYTHDSGNPSGDHVPPAESEPQNYRAPLNNGGNIPGVSHWFICYDGDVPPPDEGSLSITKEVLDPPVGAIVTVPTTFSVSVTCTDGTDEDFVLPFDDGGTPNFTVVVTDIDANSECTVTEDSSGLPEFTKVTITGGTTTEIDPAGTPATVSGGAVQVPGGGQAEVTVTNDFSGLEIQPADVVRPAEPIAAPARFTG